MDIRSIVNWPIIRIQKIVLENFKGVTYGEIVLNGGKSTSSDDDGPDILGIYGQNGSGKTAIIDALSILSTVLAGRPIDPHCSDLISKGADYSKLSFTFDFRYPHDNRRLTVVYSFKLGYLQEDEYVDYMSWYYADMGQDVVDMIAEDSKYYRKVKIYDEVLSAGGEFKDHAQKMQDILTSAGESFPIGPVRKITHYVGEKGKKREQLRIDLEVNKRTALKTSRSFFFCAETLNLFADNSGMTPYVMLMVALSWYANTSLFVVNTSMTMLDGDPSRISFYTNEGVIRVSLSGAPSILSQKDFEWIERIVSGINIVLPALVSGLKIEIEHDPVLFKDEKRQEVRLYSEKNGCRIPLRSESAGLIRIISILSLIISVYNDEAITVAIDELDAGVYEYLLGELLSGLETYGKGQFIFTSHNLRPLEVLKKQNIVFTTANPKNKYIRLKGVGHTNNLRRLYMSEITGNTQDEIIYDAAKSQRMNAAFLRAGEKHGEEE